MEPLKVVTELWNRIGAHDWPAVGTLIAEDAVIEWPVSAERIVGRANFLAVLSDMGQSTYADDTRVRLLRALADGDRVVTEVEMADDHVVYRGVSLWTVRDGEVVDGREYWTSPGQDPAPRWRAGYVEPLTTPLT
ncbi:nuclear transport factor 2 family protein [Streptomyces antimicrobicus]|uniref:Nuclear transport factor 2 family protein n=1 Tax=Streptomyces antimicrobicus TaxID=2883108 RepID=A0ABS8B2B4_9ACTN|nr:nuclear transport factor 2 family protein [Streptomyces antimicrobicus]MCB5178747.1 nuclear transport factor 2 family protein [Streptomyces antimicrobicus]